LLADDNENHMLMLINCWILDHVLQFTASPWTTEANTSERWQFG